MPVLTALRGLAALWVILYHYSVQYLPAVDPAPFTHLIGKGYLAVDMFFMLSGFVMTHVYHRAFCEAGGVRRNYGRFLSARFARLYPLHIFVLLSFAAVALAAGLTAGTAAPAAVVPWTGTRSVAAFVANIFMLQGVAAGSLSWNYPAWSISIELIAYLVFPFALPLIWRATTTGKVCWTLLLAAALIALAAGTHDNFDQWDGPITLLRGLPEFFLGALLYCFFRETAAARWLGSDIAAFGMLAAAIALLHFGAPDIAITALFAVAILAAATNSARFAKLLGAGLLIWLGEISYSLYLVHGFVEFTTDKILERFHIGAADNLPVGIALVLMLLMVSISFLLATASYRYVEMVWRGYLRVFFNRLLEQRGERPRPVAVAARRYVRGAYEQSARRLVPIGAAVDGTPRSARRLGDYVYQRGSRTQ